MEHIFVSYTQDDGKVAHMIADELARWGITPSIDERLDKLRNWPLSIQESIKACSVFILIMSPEARKSSWVQKEIEYAKSIHKLIFPILISGEAWGAFTSPSPLDIRNGHIPGRNFYLKLQDVLQKSQSATNSPLPTSSKPKTQNPSVSGNRAFPYLTVAETLAAIANRRHGRRCALGEYIIEVSGSSLTIRLADDQVILSGGQAIPSKDKEKVLGQSQPITVSYEQSNYDHRAGYRMNANNPSKFRDIAIEMTKLYMASGLNPNDLLIEPTQLP